MNFAADLEKNIDYEASRRGFPDDFQPLPEIPGRRYTSPDMYQLEQDHIWHRSWVCIGREDGLKQPGCYRTLDFMGVPILLVRGKDQLLRAFYNTCRHRGAPVVREQEGHTTLLRCQYHSWSYDLGGNLVGVPDERDFACLDKNTRGLMTLRCEVWAGWIFISENPDAPPLLEYLGELPDQLASVNMGELRLIDTRRYEIGCNWKAAVDAFLEVYHLKTIHPSTAAIMLDHTASAMTLMANGHSRMATRKRLGKGVNFAEMAGAPGIAGIDPVFSNNNVAYSIFPNVVVPIDTVGFPFLLFWPVSPDHCIMEAVYIGPDWGEEARPAYWDEYLEIFHQVLEEDMSNLEPIQASLRSKAFSGMMINYQERRIYWMHQEVDKRIGEEVVPPGLAVQRVLEPSSTHRATSAQGQENSDEQRS